MKKLRKRAALIAAIVLLLQSTVGVYAGLPSYAANDTDVQEETTDDSSDNSDGATPDAESDDDGKSDNDSKSDDSKSDDAKSDDTADDGKSDDEGVSNDADTTDGSDDADATDSDDATDAYYDGTDDGDTDETGDETTEETEEEAEEEWVPEYTYEEGTELYVLQLEKGDVLDKGVRICLFIDTRARLKYVKELMNSGVKNIRDHEVQKFHIRYIYAYLLEAGKRTQVNDDPRSAYETDQPVVLTKISKNYSDESVSLFFEPYTGNEREVTQTRRGDVVSGDDLETGDIIAAKSTVSVGRTEIDIKALGEDGNEKKVSTQTNGIYDTLSVYLDGNEEPANEDPTEYMFPTKARVISAEPNPSSPKNLVLTCETFYGSGEVGSEESLNAALTQEDSIKIASDIELTEPLTIDDGNSHTIDLNGYVLSRSIEGSPRENGNVICVDKDSELILKDSSEDQAGTLTGGNARSGGAIYVGRGTLRMNGGSIMENTAVNGGGVCVEIGTAEFEDVTFRDNETVADETRRVRGAANMGQGGAIMNMGTCLLENCEIVGNSAVKDGGGVWNGSSMDMTECTLDGNYARGYGGAICSKGTTAVSNSDIKHNTGYSCGGGISNFNNLTLTDCTVDGNSTEVYGGGIQIGYGAQNTVFEGENIIRNNTAVSGGGIYDEISKNLELKHMTISGNVSTKEGGGIHALATENLTLDDVTISNNTGAYGGGMRANGNVFVENCTINNNYSNGDGGGIYYGIRGGDCWLTVTDTTITGNICTYNGAGIWMAQDGTSTNLKLGGGLTVISGNMRNRDGKSKENNLMFYKLRVFKIAGKFEEGSIIGVDHWLNFDWQAITKCYRDYNSEPIDTFFVSDNQEYRVKRDDKQPEVVLEKKLLPSASEYTVRVKVDVTNDADDWNGALCHVYAKANHGYGEEKLRVGSGDITDYIDHGGGSYDSGTKSCGTYFPSKVNVYTDFGSYGVGPRDFEADVRIWINDILVKNEHIRVDCFGRTRTKKMADNWITIPSSKYPYPEEYEIEQKREIDVLEPDTGIVTISAVNQYGLTFVPGEYTMQNDSYPSEDLAECLDGKGLKWKFDTKRLKDCHNSKYRLGFKSGADFKPWTYIDITVRFRVPLNLIVKIGNSKDGYREIEHKTGHQNTSVDVTAPEIALGYKLNMVKKESGTGNIITNPDGSYSFKLLTTDAVMVFETAPIKYKIVYDRNASSKKIIVGTMNKETVSYDSSVVLAGNTYKSGDKEKYPYVFAGWNTAPDGSGVSYTDKQVVKNLSTVQGETVTLYAQWRDAQGNLVTASLFSDGLVAVWAGLGVTLLLGMVFGCVVSIKRR